VKRSLLPLLAIVFVALVCGAGSYVPGVPPIEEPLGIRLPLLSVVPFAALLGSIALLPVFAGHWWESNANKAKIAAFFSLPLAVLLVFHFGRSGLEELAQRILEYVSLMALLGSLYVVCGGILVEGSPAGTPLVNTAILALGAVLANVIGTTGASMVLIRPLIRANEHRHRIAHIPIFLIFIVANCGGLLTPLGDPPLFLGHLAGVPFGWTFRLFPAWALVNGVLLGIFLVWDWAMLHQDKSERPGERSTQLRTQEPLRVRGLHNVALMLGIVATVVAAGEGLGNGGNSWPFGIQEGVLAALTVASLALTNRDLRERNRFTFGPMIEVAVLFAGIFITMTPALLILNARGGHLGLHAPWQFFWASGLLSSALDNAPTYLALTAVACGSQGVVLQGRPLEQLLEQGGNPLSDAILAAISCGCVFMGALTYIGNGPNFMIKAIAEESNVRMPGFFRYMAYSMAILVPLFVLVTILFFRF
jgi:Na+/H+ antiporter NhaD/arsenite permease-like protein